MIDAAIVPNREIIRVLPPVAHLQIVILDNELDKPIKRALTLLLGQLVDLLHVVSNTEYRLPAGHRVGPDNWMDGLQSRPDILWSTSRLVVQLKVICLRSSVEVRLRVRSRELIEELLIRL